MAKKKAPNKDNLRKAANQRRRQRPSRQKKHEKLSFLCERHVGRSIREAISELGFGASDPGLFGFPENASDAELVVAATERSMVFVTRDKGDCLDTVRFPPGAHGGILVLDIEATVRGAEREIVKRFLRQHYKLCKTNVVHLTADGAFVYVRRGPVRFVA